MKHDQINLYSLFNTIDTDADVIAKEQIVPLEFKAFVHANSKLSGGSDWDYKTGRYGRDKSEYQIYSMIARITDNVVYVRDFMTYPFLYVCGSVKEADKLYKAHVDKNSYGEEITVHVPIDDMYRIFDAGGKFSVKEYADKKNFGYRSSVPLAPSRAAESR